MQEEQTDKCSKVSEFAKMMISNAILREEISTYCDKNFYEWLTENCIELGEKMYDIDISLSEKIKIYNEILDTYLQNRDIKVNITEKYRI